MKLTIPQMTLLKMCVGDAAQRYEQIAGPCINAESKAQWLHEAAEARKLLAILDDALFITVESMHLTPGDHTLEGWDSNEANGATPAAQVPPHPEASPTGLPSPSPRALRLASSLSKRSLQNLVGFPPLPAHVLRSRCSTILNSKGETEPLDEQDLQAAARHLWTQKGHKPDLPPLNPAPEGCQGSLAEPHAALADSASPAPHSTKESSLNSSSLHSGESCGDINSDGQRDDRAPLIILIDACASVDAARRAVADATPAALRNAARYLRTDLHSLPSAITRRVRERLSKAA